MKLQHISEFRFLYDNSFDTGIRVVELLGDLPKQTDEYD
jgi:ribosome-binding factor A